VLGAGLLWFGWLGFNGGSALAANGLASTGFLNTFFAPAAAALAWGLAELFLHGRMSGVGLASGAVAGMVAITPAAGFVKPVPALALGALAALASFTAIRLRPKLGLDDSLDVLSAHGVGGMAGALLTGVFARAAWGGTEGLLGGNALQVGKQALAVAVTIVYSAVAGYLLLRLVGLVTPLRATVKEEGLGLDVPQHGEEAYGSGEGAILVMSDGGSRSDRSSGGRS
jgi:Amt family ammonium transporter